MAFFVAAMFRQTKGSTQFKAQLVEGSGNGYLNTACDYVHLNPVRAGLLRSEDRLVAYPWSSLMWYLSAPEHRPGWMRVDRLLGEHGLGADTPANRQEFERRMEARGLEETDQEALKVFRRGRCLGGGEFKRQMLAWAVPGVRMSGCRNGSSRRRQQGRPIDAIKGNEQCTRKKPVLRARR